MNSINKTAEWQFDGLVGPTHNYAGLAFGNVAAMGNAGAVSNPRLAALQGLSKMQQVRDLGVPQALLPPHPRPVLQSLEQIGFKGNKSKILEDCYRVAPQLLASVYSSAFMWAANAATIIPSADSEDGKLHITPANLLSNFHRSLELSFSTKIFGRIFNNSLYFKVHNPLPQSILFSDEGAANHMRVCSSHQSKAHHVFVYGSGYNNTDVPRRFPARQHQAAFEAIQRNSGLHDANCTFIGQNPEVIDQGVFHNDVIAMNTTRLMIAHTKAFTQPLTRISETLCRKVEDVALLAIDDDVLTVPEAVSTYFFNSQLLALEDGSFVLLAPAECERHPRARALCEQLSSGNGPLARVEYLDVRESMRNGGGPACLRLRIVLTAEESVAMHQGTVLTDRLLEALRAWVHTHYRDRLCFEDLRDTYFIDELNDAYAALEEIIGMPGLYGLA